MALAHGGVLPIIKQQVRPTPRPALHALGAGVLFAAAYLTRPEGLVYACAIAALLVLMRGQVVRERLLNVIALLAPMVATVILYNAYAIVPRTGSWGLTAKSVSRQRTYELPLAEGEAEGYSVAALGEGRYDWTTDASTQSGGAWLKRVAKSYYEAYAKVLPVVFDLLLVALFSLGLYEAWRLHRLGPAHAVALAPMVMLLIVPPVALVSRLFEPILLPVLVFAGLGLAALSGASERGRTGILLSLCVFGVLALLYAKPNFDLVQDSWTGGIPFEEKEAGTWLRRHAPSDASIMERKTNVAFYARRKGVMMPYGEFDEILDYTQKHGATHVVVSDRRTPRYRPQLGFLLNTSRVPDGLELLYDKDGPPHWRDRGRIRIFRIVR